MIRITFSNKRDHNCCCDTVMLTFAVHESFCQVSMFFVATVPSKVRMVSIVKLKKSVTSAVKKLETRRFGCVLIFCYHCRFCKHTDENKRTKVALILDKLITLTIEEVEVIVII